jgi:hypothetical protein
MKNVPFLMPQRRADSGEVLMGVIRVVDLGERADGRCVWGARFTGDTHMDDTFRSILRDTGARRAAVAEALPLDDADVVRMIAHAL